MSSAAWAWLSFLWDINLNSLPKHLDLIPLWYRRLHLDWGARPCRELTSAGPKNRRDFIALSFDKPPSEWRHSDTVSVSCLSGFHQNLDSINDDFCVWVARESILVLMESWDRGNCQSQWRGVWTTSVESSNQFNDLNESVRFSFNSLFFRVVPVV